MVDKIHWVSTYQTSTNSIVTVATMIVLFTGPHFSKTPPSRQLKTERLEDRSQ